MSNKKTIYFKFFYILILCFLSFVFYAQSKSVNIKTINGKKYYIHKVEKGQSLYAISRLYNIDINSVLVENDEALDGLKNGQELKIPFESLLPKSDLFLDTLKYYYHKIEKGETIYGITKKFNIDENRLFQLNPQINNGLKEGGYIVVGEKNKPSLKNKEIKNKDLIETKNNANLYYVLQGESLFSISRKFNVSQDKLLEWNPEAKEGLKQGQLLHIRQPQLTENTTLKSTASSEPILANSFEDNVKPTTLIHKTKKTSYSIGLMLPFKLAESEGIDIEDLLKNKSSFPPTQSLALDFYFGFKKAVDSIISKDFEIDIHLFDVDEKDSLKVEEICQTSEFKKLDLIFGPLYAGVFKLVSNNAKKMGITIISPLTQQNKILYNNPYVSKVNPSQYTLIKSLADYCSDSLILTSNIIAVNATKKDASYLQAFKSRYNESISQKKHQGKDTLIEVKGIAGVKEAYNPSKKNIVILLTNNQVYLQDFITQLYMLSNKRDITLMGFQSISTNDNLDQDYLNYLNFHFAAPNRVDIKDSVLKPLIHYYQSSYYTDPSEYFFHGFDIATYYLSHLKSEGPNVFLELDKKPWTGISTAFKFYRPDLETGFENRAVYIYKYSNYQIQKLGWK